VHWRWGAEWWAFTTVLWWKGFFDRACEKGKMEMCLHWRVGLMGGELPGHVLSPMSRWDVLDPDPEN